MVMWASLRASRRSARLWALCLDDFAMAALCAVPVPGVTPLRLSDLEAWDPELARARGTRSLYEYYFTLSPVLPLYLLEKEPGIDRLTYVDADLWFFGEPGPLYEEMGDASVSIVPHRFSPGLEHLREFGVYNVGWLTFRRDARSLQVLRWWRERCLEWCGDSPRNGLFADQAYLNDWPERFEGVHVLGHPGANVGPWNVGQHELSRGGGVVRVDRTPVLFFHFSGIRSVAGTLVWWARLESYNLEMSAKLFRWIYAPYLRALSRAERYWAARTSRAAGAEPSGPRGRPVLSPRNVLGWLLSGKAMTPWVHRSMLAGPRGHVGP